MDKIFINSLRIKTLIGVNPHERKFPQDLLLDLEVFFVPGPSKETDNIADAIDYDTICNFTVKLVQESKFRLIEKLAETIANSILQNFDVSEVKIRITKPEALKFTSEVGIEITRGRTPS